MDNPKQRHKALAVWLILMMLSNAAMAAMAVMAAAGAESLQANFAGLPNWFPGAMAALCALNAVFAIAIWKWQRWGFFGFVVTSLIAFGLNLYLGLGVGPAIFGLGGLAVLFGVLQLGGFNSGWSQLEPRREIQQREFTYNYRSTAGAKYVLRAIFKRDFVSYFSSPTGYVFICVFVVLSALATFWPPEFFANNLANLDQLSRWLPFIMLVFIPAITMSIWAEERRQGTDELLLTIPASDFDVVLGKYLAGVAIFTVSLLFSGLSIYTVFRYGLGDPDFGLFVSTYVGYWFIGLAMIAIGMVASFLTSNLTVGFILGTLFNLPLAAFGVADWFIKDPAWAERIRHWGAEEQFADFQRGVLSLGGVAYFIMIAAVMVYLSMILIGRRHWQAREEGGILLAHYLTRVVALLVIAGGATALIQNRNWLRADVSYEQLSSVSDETRDLIDKLRDNDKIKLVKIDAYISPQVPTEFASTKLNLISTLEELRALGRGKIVVVRHEIPTYGAEAELAAKNFGITPQEQYVKERGESVAEEFFLGVAVTSGLDKVVTPFLNKGIPVEYELVRSIMTVSGAKRLRVGIVDTGLSLTGAEDGSREGEWPLVTELRKQYDVVRVDPKQTIKGGYDALLAVQPSMLDPASFDHLVDAIRNGTPTAVLEDPWPYFYNETLPGTSQPKQSEQSAQMQMFGMQPQEEPKGDIQQLWRLLGIKSNPAEVVFQLGEVDPSVKLYADPQWVFVDHDHGAPEPFSEKDPVTAGLNQILLLYPGALAKADDSTLVFEQLAQTGVGNSGVVPAMALHRFDGAGPSPNKAGLPWERTRDGYIIAAHITGKPPEDDAAQVADLEVDDENDPADQPEAKAAGKSDAAKNLNVIVVADIDWVIPSFFQIRESGDKQFLPVTQNVPMILNIIDELTGDDRFIEIRKRARIYRTLKKIDETTKNYRKEADDELEKTMKDITDKVQAAQDAMQAKIDEIQDRPDMKELEMQVAVEQTRLREQEKLQAEASALASEQKLKEKEIAFKRDQEVRAVQDRYKMFAILIPPIPPLLLALAVFFHRRELERQGIARERLR